MALYRLTKSARSDIGSILRTSEERHGRDASTRYAALLLAAMRRVAENPEGRSTSERCDLRPGIRSFHIRHSRNESREAPVASPVHVIFYRIVQPGIVQIVRVLHDRMDPRQYVGPPQERDADCMTPQQFIQKWKRTTLSERATAQEHFIDLCRMLAHPTPVEDDPIGDHFTFEKA